jgi:23S rRNA (uracil1939-C5)-methyltransferase
VRDALERIGGFDPEEIPGARVEIVGSPDSYGYRARARLVESDGTIGYRERGSHAMLGVEECPVLLPPVEQALVRLARSVREPERAREAAAAHDIARPTRRRAASEWILTCGTSGSAITQRAGRGRVRAESQEFVSLEILGESLRVGTGSFVQGNAMLWEALADEVRSQCTLIHVGEHAQTRPERFVELYCGIGFLTLPIARRGLSGVVIESDRSAVTDLEANLAASGLADRIEVLCGRAESRRDLARHFQTADLLLVDPPRAGLAARVRDAIVSSGPPRLVYVSCDPATLARDLRLFSRAGYELASLRAFDLFPQTPHVEVVARLERAPS